MDLEQVHISLPVQNASLVKLRGFIMNRYSICNNSFSFTGNVLSTEYEQKKEEEETWIIFSVTLIYEKNVVAKIVFMHMFADCQ